MRYTFPKYFDSFRCVAAECTDTCCAGWAINIDEASLSRYEKLDGAFGKRVKESINWKDGSFCQRDKRCIFLNEENLCDMHMIGGEKMLCDTCKNYPRHMEEYEGLREGSLSLSCIEAAKIILGCQEPVQFVTLEDEVEDEEYEDFDFLLFTKLTDARDCMIGILQDRSLDSASRMAIVLRVAGQIQEFIDAGEMFRIDDLLLLLQQNDAHYLYQQELAKAKMGENEYFTSRRKLLRMFRKLEVLSEEWPDYLKKAEWSLFGKGQAVYEEQWKKFHQEIEIDNYETWSSCMEQLAVYFLYVYFCGAVYDDMIYTKAVLSVFSLLWIREILLERWYIRGEDPKLETVCRAAWEYAREIEHSDENLNLLEEIFNGSALYKPENFLPGLTI